MHTGVQHISEAQAVYLEKFLNYSGTIIQLAAELDIPLVDMIDTLSSPEVLSRIQNTKLLTDLKLEILAARAELAALETLEEITKNKAHDPVERRRAAGAILRATRSIRSRARSRSRTPGAPPVPSDPSPPSMPATDPANYCTEEFLDELREARKNSPASNMTSSQVCTSDLVDSEALYSQDETTKPLEETTQSRIELDELCAKDGDSDFDPTPKPNISSNANSHSRGTGIPPVPASSSPSVPSPTPHPRPSGASESSHGWSPDRIGTEPVEDEHTRFAPEGQAKRTQTQNGSNSPQQTNNDSPIPGKDNPWEGHPFQLAGNRVFGSSRSLSSSRPSNHDPP